MTQQPVAWGATSKLLLTTFLASLIPTISTWISSGEMPTREAALSACLLAGLAVVRVVQQLVLDNVSKYMNVDTTAVVDTATIPDSTVVDPQA